MSLRAPQSEAERGGPGHVGELRLRRLRAGELTGSEAEAAERHLEGCAGCRERVEALLAEERAFAAAIPFPRFAGGVERAARVPRPRRVSRRAVFTGGAFGLVAVAAGLLLVLRAGPLSDAESERSNRVKGAGGVSAIVRLASATGAQRSIAPGGGGKAGQPGSATRLEPGDRLRLGITTSSAAHVLALSLDDAGAVTLLHGSERGEATPPVASGASGSAVAYLPDSFELTGGGRERIFLFVAERPLSAEELTAAVKAGHAAAAGDLRDMADPALGPGITTFSWLFEKP
jgi:hypothetical protein